MVGNENIIKKDLSNAVAGLANILDGYGGEGEVALDSGQVELLRNLIEKSAADQMLIIQLQRRLKRYTEAGLEIEAEVGKVFARVRAHAASGKIDQGYDYERVKSEREAFVRNIEQAKQSKDIVIGVLGLVAKLAPFL